MAESERVQQLRDWRFEFFEHLSISDELHLESVLSNDDFELIERAMTDKELDLNELYHSLLLADKFLAKDEALEKIFSAFIRLSTPQIVRDLAQAQHHMVFCALKNCISRSPAIKFDDVNDELVLEGEDIMIESKNITFKLFSSFAVHYSGIRIKDFRLREAECQIIQSMLQSHVTSVSFVNCEFHFDFSFDFSKLTQLSHFECTKCVAKGRLAMLESIPPKNLKYLDFSATRVDLPQRERLMQCLLKFEKLETLKCNFVGYVCTGDLLSLPSLIHLEVRDTVTTESFIEKLEQLDKPLNLEYLSISDSGLSAYDDYAEQFLKNAEKLPKLKCLDLSGCVSDLFVRALIDRKNSQCCFDNLKEIVARSFRKNVISLHRKIKEYGIDLKMRSKKLQNAYELNELYCFENVVLNLARFDASAISDMEDFDNVVGLEVFLPQFSKEPRNHFQNFLAKFSKIEKLKAFVTNHCDFDCLAQLVANNPINELVLHMFEKFIGFEPLISAIKNSQFKRFAFNFSGFFHQLIHSTEASFWSEMNWLFFLMFPCDSTTFLFNNFKLPKLRELHILVVDDPLTDAVVAPILSLRRLTIELDALCEELKEDVFERVLLMFPNITELKVEAKGHCNLPDIAKLCPNLRRVVMQGGSYSNDKEIQENLQQLPFITEIDIYVDESS